MKRRKFIIYSALSAAAATAPFLNCTGPDTEFDKKIAVPEKLSQIYDEKTIMEIGMAYGKAYPEEYNIKDIESLLKKDKEGKSISASMAVSEIKTIMDNKVQHDFNSGNTIILNGWILSITEARQCALFSLIPKK
jgi:hypothetical protein